MTVQLIIMGTRRPDSDDDYAAYATVAVPIMVEAGGTFTGQYGRIDDLVGDDGPHVVGIMEFADEAAVRAAIKGPEYQAVVPHRSLTASAFGSRRSGHRDVGVREVVTNEQERLSQPP